MSPAITNLNTRRRLIHGDSIPNLSTCNLYPILLHVRGPDLSPGTTLYHNLIHGDLTPPPPGGRVAHYITTALVENL